MKVSLYRIDNNELVLNNQSHQVDVDQVNLILCFGDKKRLADHHTYKLVRSTFPLAHVTMCSAAGEIYQEAVLDHSVIVIAFQFERTRVEAVSVNLKDYQNTYSAAMALAQRLPAEDLTHVMVFSDGSLVNGSELAKGLSSQFNRSVVITGGLAADGSDFQSTLVGLNQPPVEGEVVLMGLYGPNIQITHGSQGGWDIFGLEKRVTNSAGNVLMELEDQNALALYKLYLGDEAKNLPGSALLFPLSVLVPGAKKPVVRTILSINEEERSMTFAGDVPVGSVVRFMKANLEKLIQAAADAATLTILDSERKPHFSLLISCVGRKLILGSKITEEVKAASKSFDHQTLLAGFYSYGEISPFDEGGSCQLHNQTMTITSFYEN